MDACTEELKKRKKLIKLKKLEELKELKELKKLKELIHMRNQENLSKLIKQINLGHVIPYVGAGLSCPLYPDWGKYLQTLIQKQSYKLKKEIEALGKDYEAVAQKIYDKYPLDFIDDTQEVFSPDKLKDSQALGKSVLMLPSLFRGPMITTNLDQVLETVYRNANVPVKVVAANEVGVMKKTVWESTPSLWKIHGDVERTATWVLTERQYNKLYGGSNQFKNLFLQYLNNYQLLFLGCSLGQDRITSILAEMAADDPTKVYHFALLPLPFPLDPEQFNEKRARLQHMGIHPIWYETFESEINGETVESHSNLAVVLGEIQRQVKLPHVQAVRKETTVWLPPDKDRNSKTPPERRLTLQLNRRLEQHQLAVLYGTQGVGKTEAAIAYYHDVRADWNVVWLDCQSEEIFSNNLKKYLESMEISDVETDEKKQAYALFERLEQTLVIFDDANLTDLQEWIAELPRKGCRYLVTTYRYSTAFEAEVLLKLPPLKQAEARTLFQEQNHMSVHPTPAQLKTLINYCGGLPLTICQAADYLSHTRCSVEEYLKMLQNQIEEMDTSYTARFHNGSYATFAQTFQTISSKQNRVYKIAGKLLRYIACLSPTRIQEDFLRELDLDFTNDKDYFDGIAVCHGFGVLDRSRDGCLTIPGIVQQVFRSCLSQEEELRYLEAIAKLLLRKLTWLHLTDENMETVANAIQNLKFIQSLESYARLEEEMQAELSCQAGRFWYEIWDFKKCREDYLTAEQFGNAIIRSKAQIGLAQMFELKDDYESAERYLQKLQSEKTNLNLLPSEDHVDFLLVRAFTAQGRGQLEESLQYFVEAFQYLDSISMEQDKLDNCRMHLLNGMGNSFYSLGRDDIAEQCYDKALKFGSRLFTDGVPPLFLRIVKGNKAKIYVKRGQFEDAEQIYQKEAASFLEYDKTWKEQSMELWSAARKRKVEAIDEAFFFFNYAHLYIQWQFPGHLEKALEYLQRADDLMKDSHNEQHSIRLDIYAYICQIYYILGDKARVMEAGKVILDPDLTFRSCGRTERNLAIIHEMVENAKK